MIFDDDFDLFFIEVFIFCIYLKEILMEYLKVNISIIMEELYLWLYEIIYII